MELEKSTWSFPEKLTLEEPGEVLLNQIVLGVFRRVVFREAAPSSSPLFHLPEFRLHQAMPELLQKPSNWPHLEQNLTLGYQLMFPRYPSWSVIAGLKVTRYRGPLALQMVLQGVPWALQTRSGWDRAGGGPASFSLEILQESSIGESLLQLIESLEKINLRSQGCHTVELNASLGYLIFLGKVFQQAFVKAHSIMPGAMEGRKDAEPSLVALSANWGKKKKKNMCRIQQW